ncbi:MAG: shikimate dehydrogenase [Ruminococcaceae bacterium]|jgi:shikimate dehydrogenase|nr:shikimate dehydrogenase [Oscillospiraceae bacterium]
MKCGLLGEKLGHSFSREIHEKLGRYSYELIEVAPDALDAFLTRREFDGLNVTIPYKQAVIPYLDEISGRAARIGAVNTIVNRDGKLYGDNTDFGGLTALIGRMGLTLAGKTVLICGTGGTSRTALAAAEALGAGRVVRLSRSGREGAATYEEARARFADADVLINTTPVGMYPNVNGTPVDPAWFPGLTGVVDVVYNPLTTRLVRLARARGVAAENGLYMLVAQAVLAAEAFTGERFGAETMERIYGELLFGKRSIVLTGMPGSGKSTLGRLLASRLGRTLTDTDERIVARAGMPISEIFQSRGEAYFRDLEAQAVADACQTPGAVIATGGGAVLRAENVDAMKQNGVVVFLDRPLEGLLPTDDRPLADDKEKLRRLYAERLPVYRAAADVTVSVRGTPEETADDILNRLRAMGREQA